MAMGQEEMMMWRKRLDHAHREWKNAGLIPDTRQGTTQGYHMMRYLDGYRGDFAPALDGGTEAADQMVGNIFFSLMNTMVTQVSGNVPDPILRPLGGDVAGRDARRRAWLNEQVARTLIREKKYKREVQPAVMSAAMTGMGIVRHGITPEEEYEDEQGRMNQRFSNHTPDLPWIQMLRPWQIRIDPMVNSFDPDSEPGWCAFHNLWFEHQVRRNPNLIFREDLVPTHNHDLRPLEDRKGTRTLANDDDVMPMYEEWVIYDFEERKWFGFSPGSEKLIRREEDWPMGLDQLPYSFLGFNPQLDTPFPIPYPRMIWDEQRMYNKIWTILNAVISRTRRVIAYNENAVDPDQAAILTNPESIVEAIATQNDPRAAIADLGFGSFDGQLIGLLFQLKEQFREVLGISSFDRGQRANVETASEANQIGQGSELARSRNQEQVEAFWTNIIKVSHRSFLQNSEARTKLIPIIGQENLEFLTADERAQGFTEVEVGDLRGEFDYAVRLNSTMKIDPAQELAAKSGVYQMLGGQKSRMLQQRYFHETIMELAGIDPTQGLISEEVLAKEAQIEAQGAEAAGVEGEQQPEGSGVQSGMQGMPDIRSLPGGRG